MNRLDLLDSDLQIQEIDTHTWVISQGKGRGRTHCYLLVGNNKAALIDTGLGLVQMRTITDALTTKEVIVINTHGHFDHISGNHEYEHVYLHPKDDAIYWEHSTKEFRNAYLTSRYLQKGFPKELLHQSPYKERFQAQVCLPRKAYEPLYEGMCIELGERTLQIIATPGHTPGSICILDKTHRYLFSGDSICEAGVLLNFPYSTTIEVFRRSLSSIQAYASMFDVIYAGHQKIPLAFTWIEDYIRCADDILMKKTQFKDEHSTNHKAHIQYTYPCKKEEAMENFTYEYIRPSILRICDQMQVAMYLVIGKKKACLIDTGCGFGNLAEFVGKLTDKPVFVILTHGHFDHAGGAAQFADVYLHPQDIEVYQKHNTMAFRKAMFQTFYGKEMPVEDVVRKQPFLPLSDEQTFDLGGISVQMIHVCGHTPGMMMAFIPEERIILFGDACGVNVMLYEDWASDVSTYKQSLQHVKDVYATRYDYVIRNHGTFTSPCSILDEVISCCEDILLQKDDHIPTEVFGMQGFYRAKAVDEQGNRCDGNIGNIVYRFDKAK